MYHGDSYNAANDETRGAYCAMTIISLLDLPIDLPPEAEARRHGLRLFSSGLPEYLSRCTENLNPFLNIAHIDEPS
jgi:hypothetical protein